MAKFELKPLAHSLRRKGKSVLEISHIVGISKSTASLWCREIELTPIQKINLRDKMIRDGHAGRMKGAQVNRDKKITAQKGAKSWAKKTMRSISNRDRLMIGVALYWAEGSKAMTTTGFMFVNSDPVMVKFMVEWLVLILGIPIGELKLQIVINEIHTHRIGEVLRFWSSLLDLSPDSFSKPYFSKIAQKKVYEYPDAHYGMIRLGVMKSTLLKYRVLEMIQVLKADVAQVVRANAS